MDAREIGRGRTRVIAGAVAEGLPLRCAVPGSASVSWRNGSSGFITRANSKAVPSPFGVQSAMVMPFGT